MERQRADRISIEKAKRGIAMLRNGTAGKAKTGEGRTKNSVGKAKRGSAMLRKGKARIDNAEDLLGWLCDG
jgi:hypothetical protein